MIRLFWLVLVAGAVFAWDHSAVGLGWAALVLGLAFVALGVRAKGGWGRRVWLLGSSPLLALTVLEFGLHQVEPPLSGDHEPGIFRDDEDLGYRLEPSSEGWHTKRIGSQQIFRSYVTIGADGWRVVPAGGSATGEIGPTSPERAVDILGCSFAFGYGLSDDEALPSVLQARLGTTARVHNFSVRGWGPHQLLASLQSGRIAPEPDIPTDWVIYWAISAHANRVAGRRCWWDPRGPRFEVSDGLATRAGNFDASKTEPLVRKIARRLKRRSAVARRLLNERPDTLEATSAELERWAAIVDGIRLEIGQWTPSPRFLVLLDVKEGIAADMQARLEARDIEVLDLSSALSGAASDDHDHRIHPLDGHPSAASIPRVADLDFQSIHSAD